MADTFQPIAPRPSPVRTTGAGPWLKANLFADWRSSVTTIFLLVLGLAMIPKLLNWGVLQAVFSADADACHARCFWIGIDTNLDWRRSGRIGDRVTHDVFNCAIECFA